MRIQGGFSEESVNREDLLEQRLLERRRIRDD